MGIGVMEYWSDGKTASRFVLVQVMVTQTCHLALLLFRLQGEIFLFKR